MLDHLTWLRAGCNSHILTELVISAFLLHPNTYFHCDLISLPVASLVCLFLSSPPPSQLLTSPSRGLLLQIEESNKGISFRFSLLWSVCRADNHVLLNSRQTSEYRFPFQPDLISLPLCLSSHVMVHFTATASLEWTSKMWPEHVQDSNVPYVHNPSNNNNTRIYLFIYDVWMPQNLLLMLFAKWALWLEVLVSPLLHLPFCLAAWFKMVLFW